MSENAEVKTKKNMSWSFEASNGILTASFPSGKTWQFDLAKSFPSFSALEENEQKVFQYGARQYLSDDVAMSKENKYSEDDKIAVFEQSKKDMIENTYWKRSGKQTEKISKYVTAQFIDELAAEMDVPRAVVLKIMERKGLVERG